MTPDRHIYARWIGACALGELLGIGAAASVGAAVTLALGALDTPAKRWAAMGLVVVAACIEGGGLAFLQWRVLRVRLPRLRAAEWMIPTVGVALVGWIAGMASPIFGADASGASASAALEPSALVKMALAAGLGASAGLVFGTAQWLVLRRHAKRAGRWIWIHVLAWAAAMPFIFAGMSLPSDTSLPWFVVTSGVAGGLSAGVALGIVSGLVVRRIEPWVEERAGSMRGRVCIVTGATSGIGYEIALGLARAGATVVAACRDAARGADVRSRVLAAVPGADIEIERCDLSSLDSVRVAGAALRARHPRIDVLVHDAATMSRIRTLTEDGIEQTLGVDVVGPFLLTELLRESLGAARGRVVVLTGIYQRRGHLVLDDLHFARRSYDMGAASMQAQLGRWLFVHELARRARELTVVAVHPGGVRTRALDAAPAILRVLAMTLLRPGFVRPALGAMPALRLAIARTGVLTGRFYDRFRVAPDAPDPVVARAFWDACEQLTSGHDAAADRESPAPILAMSPFEDHARGRARRHGA